MLGRNIRHVMPPLQITLFMLEDLLKTDKIGFSEMAYEGYGFGRNKKSFGSCALSIPSMSEYTMTCQPGNENKTKCRVI